MSITESEALAAQTTANRGICPVCHRSIAVRKDGRVRFHKSGRMSNCLGEGAEPVAEAVASS